MQKEDNVSQCSLNHAVYLERQLHHRSGVEYNHVQSIHPSFIKYVFF